MVSAFKINLALLLTLCALLYAGIFASNFNFEINNKKLSVEYFKNNIEIDELDFHTSVGYVSIMDNTRELELGLRIKLMSAATKKEAVLKGVHDEYQELLKKKPTWPYLYSGLLKYNQARKVGDYSVALKSINYGPYETKIVKSVSEILFYRWNDVSATLRLELLSYLSVQSVHNVANAIKIAAKFGQVNSICDYLFTKYQEKNSVCLKNYWKPLIN